MSKAEQDTEVEKQNWHWRNSMRPARFFHLDARAAIPVFILLFHARLVTLIVTLIIVMTFWTLEKRGLTFWAALRNLRQWIIGKNRPGYYTMRHRTRKDFAE